MDALFGVMHRRVDGRMDLWFRRMTRMCHFVSLCCVVLCGACGWSQGTPTPVPASVSTSASAQPSWEYSLTTDGYIVPGGQSYVSPVFTADHQWLHLEARYNYEDQRTGSLWGGYNFSAGKKLQLSVTPMIGGVFGDLNGIAPGCEASLTYKKLEFSSTSEYVFDTSHKAGSFFYSWPEVTYSLLDWLKLGFVAQRTRAYPHVGQHSTRRLSGLFLQAMGVYDLRVRSGTVATYHRTGIRCQLLGVP